MECSICTLDYGLASDRVPRVLNCGHTFCHSCLNQCLRNDAILCPFCSTSTRVTFSEVSRIPINYGILDMLAVVSQPQPEPQNDYCEACCVAPASVVCVSCSPLGVKFCTDCDKLEHDRAFKPVRLHRRVPLQEYDFTIMCFRHSGTSATHYSEKINQFACIQCHKEIDWPERSQNFLHVEDAAERMRIRAGKINYHCNNTMKSLYDTQRELEMMLFKLSESASAAKVLILAEFSKLAEVLQQCQQALIHRVEEEVSKLSYQCSYFIYFFSMQVGRKILRSRNKAYFITLES